jgi:hypothetical protein
MEIRGLAALPSVMRVLRIVAACDLHKGNDERAAEAVITLMDIFPNKSEDTWNIAEMVRWSYARVGKSLTWELLQHAKLRDETWQRLQEAWERCEFIGSYAKAARTEIAGVSDYFVRLKESAAYRHDIIDKFEQMERDFGASWNPLVREPLLRRVHVPLWCVMWADQDYAYSMRNRRTELLLAEFARTNSWSEVRVEAARHARPDEGSNSAAEETGVYDRARYLFSFSPEPLARVDLLQAFRAETEASLAISAIALHRFFVAEGRYPNRIEELIPQFLAEVPQDPLDGKPLKYRFDAGSGFLLYSSGVDGEDDGGEKEPDENAEAGLTFWSGEDVFWPRRMD